MEKEEDSIKLIDYGSDWEFQFPESVDDSYEEFYAAIEQMDHNPKKAEKVFKKCIERNPQSHIDAYNLLGILYKDQGNTIEGNALIEKAYNIGKKAIEKYIKTNAFTLPWGYLDNRSFLRACAQMGLNCKEVNQFKEASDFFELILKCNPDDNQGMRFLLMECYLKAGEFEKVITFSKKYTDEEKYSFEWVYGKGFAYYHLHELELAKEAFSQGKVNFPLVYNEALKKNKFKDPTKKLPGVSEHIKGGVYSGSELEAYNYYDKMRLFFDDKKIKEFIAKS